MEPCCSHTVGHCFSLDNEVSSSKTDKENAFFVTFMYVTICDLHGHRRSQVMVQSESLYMSSYLCIIVTIGLSGTVTKI